MIDRLMTALFIILIALLIFGTMFICWGLLGSLPINEAYIEMVLYCLPIYIKYIFLSSIIASLMMEINKRFFSDEDDLL